MRFHITADGGRRPTECNLGAAAHQSLPQQLMMSRNFIRIDPRRRTPHNPHQQKLRGIANLKRAAGEVRTPTVADGS